MANLETNRIHGLEGIRGILALIVYVHHFLLIFHPGFYFEKHNIWNILLNPDFAVVWFFVHSGLVLSYKTAKVEDRKILFPIIWDQIKRRYIRLLPPVLFSIFLTCLFMKLGFIHNQTFAKIIDSKWLGNYLNFSPSWSEALYQSFYGAFFNFRSHDTFNSSLWTISYEMISSYLLFGILLLTSFKKGLRFLLIPLAFIIGPWKGMMAFLLGAALNFLPLQKKISYIITVPLLIAGLYLSDLDQFSRYIGSTMVMIAVLYMKEVRNFFEQPFFKRLGELSYSLYVMHFLVLASITSYLGIVLKDNLNILNIFIIFGFSTLFLWLLAEICERFFDRPGQKLAKRLANITKL